MKKPVCAMEINNSSSTACQSISLRCLQVVIHEAWWLVLE
uniref:Uncharacterized protein n=1 Tax=Setaria italica TaxID=4555 RepID=K3ZFN9_SETIT